MVSAVIPARSPNCIEFHLFLHLDSSGFEHFALRRDAFQQIVPRLDERIRSGYLAICA